MRDAVMSPTPEIQSTAALLDEATRRLVKAWASCEPLGEYESDVEAYNLLRLIIRHVQSVVSLASRDLVLLPSALVVSRAAYEATIKLLWLMAPDDPFEREVRWLAHLQSEEHFEIRMASRLANFENVEAAQKRAETISSFAWRS